MFASLLLADHSQTEARRPSPLLTHLVSELRKVCRRHCIYWHATGIEAARYNITRHVRQDFAELRIVSVRYDKRNYIIYT